MTHSLHKYLGAGLRAVDNTCGHHPNIRLIYGIGASLWSNNLPGFGRYVQYLPHFCSLERIIAFQHEPEAPMCEMPIKVRRPHGIAKLGHHSHQHRKWWRNSKSNAPFWPPSSLIQNITTQTEWWHYMIFNNLSPYFVRVVSVFYAVHLDHHALTLRCLKIFAGCQILNFLSTPILPWTIVNVKVPITVPWKDDARPKNSLNSCYCCPSEKQPFGLPGQIEELLAVRSPVFGSCFGCEQLGGAMLWALMLRCRSSLAPSTHVW